MFTLCLNISPSQIIVFINLTIISSSDVSVDKNHVLRDSVSSTYRVSRSEIFISEDRQLRATHLNLDYKPLSRIFQDVGQAIRVSDPRLSRIDVSKPRFLAWRDLPPIELPPTRLFSWRDSSTPLSLEAKIDQFHLEEDGEVPKRPVELSNSEANLDRFSTAHSPRLIVAQVDISSKDEEGGMDLKQRTSLKGLLANKNKGSASKDVPKT